MIPRLNQSRLVARIFLCGSIGGGVCHLGFKRMLGEHYTRSNGLLRGQSILQARKALYTGVEIDNQKEQDGDAQENGNSLWFDL